MKCNSSAESHVHGFDRLAVVMIISAMLEYERSVEVVEMGM